MPIAGQDVTSSVRTPEESVARCRRILRPTSIAVVGASPRETTLHGRVVRNLLNGGFEGPVYPVNPRYDKVCGLPCRPSVEAIGQPVDLALVLVSADRVTAAVDDCITGGVGAALIFSSGFAEAGPDGVARQAELDARRDDIAIGGPNVNAVLSRPAHACMGFGPTLEFKVADAPRALISQSGAVGTSIVTRAAAKGIGFRYVVATGNEVDLGVEDYLFALAAEAEPVPWPVPEDAAGKPDRQRAGEAGPAAPAGEAAVPGGAAGGKHHW